MKNKISIVIVALLITIIGLLVFLAINNQKGKSEQGDLTGSLKTTIVPTLTPSQEESLSEQPNKAKYDEYFSNAYLAKLTGGQKFDPSKIIKTKVFVLTDQFCISIDVKKNIPVNVLGIAVYDKNSKEYVQQKTGFPQEIKAGNMVGCENLSFPVGKYENKIYIDDILVAILPFEVVE